jgi:hypothetical protein
MIHMRQEKMTVSEFISMERILYIIICGKNNLWFRLSTRSITTARNQSCINIFHLYSQTINIFINRRLSWCVLHREIKKSLTRKDKSIGRTTFMLAALCGERDGNDRALARVHSRVYGARFNPRGPENWRRMICSGTTENERWVRENDTSGKDRSWFHCVWKMREDLYSKRIKSVSST